MRSLTLDRTGCQKFGGTHYGGTPVSTVHRGFGHPEFGHMNLVGASWLTCLRLRWNLWVSRPQPGPFDTYGGRDAWQASLWPVTRTSTPNSNTHGGRDAWQVSLWPTTRTSTPDSDTYSGNGRVYVDPESLNVEMDVGSTRNSGNFKGFWWLLGLSWSWVPGVHTSERGDVGYGSCVGPSIESMNTSTKKSDLFTTVLRCP